MASILYVNSSLNGLLLNALGDLGSLVTSTEPTLADTIQAIRASLLADRSDIDRLDSTLEDRATDAIGLAFDNSTHTAGYSFVYNSTTGQMTLIAPETENLIAQALLNYYTKTASDARFAAKVHTHSSADITDFLSSVQGIIDSQKGVADGLATLGSDGKVPSSQLSSIVLLSRSVVTNETAMLALSGQAQGDMVIVTASNVSPGTGLGKTYIHNGGATGTISDWTRMETSSEVMSVNGYVGVIVLSTTDISEGTNKYFTDQRAKDAVGGSLQNTSTVNLTYAGNIISASVNNGSINLSHLSSDFTSLGKSLASVVDQATARSLIGLGSAALLDEAVVSRVGHTHVVADITDALSTFYTKAQVDSAISASLFTGTTDNVPEGTDPSRRYFSEDRAVTAVNNILVDTTTIDVSSSLSSISLDVKANSITTSHLGGDISAKGKTLIQQTTSLGQRDELGLGNIATRDASEFSLSTHSHSTSVIPEGTNLYFTDARAKDASANSVTDTSTIQKAYDSVAKQLSLSVVPASLGTAQMSFSSDVKSFLNASDKAGMRSALSLGNVSLLDTSAISLAGHTHLSSEITDFNSASDGRITLQKGVAYGLCPLGADGKVPTAYYDQLVINDIFTKLNESEMVAMTSSEVQKGDIVNVTASTVYPDLGYVTYILQDNDPSILSNWARMAGAVAVGSVNGYTGIILLTTTDIPEGTNKYFTDNRAKDAVGSSVIDTATISKSYNSATKELSLSVKTDSITVPLIGVASDIKAFLNSATKSDARSELGLGSASLNNSSDFAQAVHSHTPSDISGFDLQAKTAAFASVSNSSSISVSGNLNGYSFNLNPSSVTYGNLSLNATAMDLLSKTSAAGLRGSLALGDIATRNASEFATAIHSHLVADISDFSSSVNALINAQKGLTSGIAPLSGGKVPSVYLPDSDVIMEGGINLFFTEDRAKDAVGSSLIDSSTIDASYNATTKEASFQVKANSLDTSHFNLATDIENLLASPTNSAAITSLGLALVFSQLGHTHTFSEITNGSSAVTSIINSLKGIANGIAPLGADGKVDPSYLTPTLNTEDVQDLVGAMLVDGSTIDFTYNDASGYFTAEVKNNSLGVNQLTFSTDVKALLNSANNAGMRSSMGLDTTYAPITHSHTVGEISGLGTSITASINAQKGVANGLVPLDSTSKIDSSYLPPRGLVTVRVVTNEAAMYALTAEEGDVVVVTSSTTYTGSVTYTRLSTGNTTDSTGWTLLPATGAVSSINGQTGAVVLTTSNVSEGSNQYFTSNRAKDAVGPMVLSSSTITASYNSTSKQLSLEVPFNSITTDNLNLSTDVENFLNSGTNAIARTRLGLGGLAVLNTSDVSLPGHTHTSANITDFNTAVDARIALSSGGSVSAEDVQDIVGAMATDSSTIDFTYDDTGNSITAVVKPNSLDTSHLNLSTNVETLLNAADNATFRTSLGLGSAALLDSASLATAVHTHTASSITDFQDAVYQYIKTNVLAGSGIIKTTDDVAKTVLFEAQTAQQIWMVAITDETSTLPASSTNAFRGPAPQSGSIVKVKAWVNTASAASATTVDILVNGNSIFGTTSPQRTTIAAGANVSLESSYVITNGAVTENDLISVSVVSGATDSTGLKVLVYIA